MIFIFNFFFFLISKDSFKRGFQGGAKFESFCHQLFSADSDLRETQRCQPSLTILLRRGSSHS